MLDINQRLKIFQEKIAELANKPMFYGTNIVVKPKPAIPKPKKRLHNTGKKPAVEVNGVLPHDDCVEKTTQNIVSEEPIVQQQDQSIVEVTPPVAVPDMLLKYDLDLPIIFLYKIGEIASNSEEYKTDIDILGVHRRGDKSNRRIKVSNLGLDIGTKTIVAAFGGKKKTEYVSEINGFWVIEKSTPFMENMLSDPKKKRSDGTERPARFIKLEDGRLVLLGRDAEEFAFSLNDTLKRPMAEGGITPDEDSITVLASIIHGMIETVEKDLGKFGDTLNLCYCTTANALNKTNNIDYHTRVIDMILKSYSTTTKINYMHIKESHAIVNNMSPDGSGIGISWGAGTVTVSYVKYGIEIFSFCWVGSGDWIDESVARRYGYDPERSKLKTKISKETPTTISKRKMSIDLTPGKEPHDRVELDIVLHYDVLIESVMNGIVTGFVENESQARIESGVSIYMAGGTSSPKGFVERVRRVLEKLDMPFEVKDIVKHENPLFCVAEGCLKAAETL